MKRLTWFLIRIDRLPSTPWLRRRLLRSIFKPAHPRDWGIDGWYDLGHDISPEQVERFKEWAEERDG
jgi:hypothetical protein